MGNKLCKKKGDLLDGSHTPNRQRSFKGIISKWNLKPKWKSDSHLNKQRSSIEEKNHQISLQASNKQNTNRPLSKSSDWTDVPLVAVTAHEAHHNPDVVYVKNAQLSMIFNDNHTPTPPPRKHHKKPMGLREKIKAVAKQGLQAVQSSGNKQPNYSHCTPVEEPMCVKKIVNYNCPHCEAVSGTCHRHRAHEASQAAAKARQSEAINVKNQQNSKTIWDRNVSSSSTNSLPTQHYGEGNKLSIAIDDLEDIDTRSSVHSLPPGVDNNDGKQQNTSTPNDIMSRARSFGSLLPQMLLHKLSTHPSGNNTSGGGKAPLAEIESDDSFGGLEDWDIGLIEHYNPKDASLPRGVKIASGLSRKEVPGNDKWRDSMISNEDEMLATLEGMIVNDETTTTKKPAPPQRKTESLLKKITRENSNRTDNITNHTNVNRSISVTPPPSPEKLLNDPFKTNNNHSNHSDDDHSTLMKIIEDYKQEQDKAANKTIDLYRHLSTEEALIKSISKTTSKADTVTHSDINRKTYFIEGDLSKFVDSPFGASKFKRMSVTDVNNVTGFGKVVSMHNDFLNAERRFMTDTDWIMSKT